MTGAYLLPFARVVNGLPSLNHVNVGSFGYECTLTDNTRLSPSFTVTFCVVILINGFPKIKTTQRLNYDSNFTSALLITIIVPFHNFTALSSSAPIVTSKAVATLLNDQHWWHSSCLQVRYRCFLSGPGQSTCCGGRLHCLLGVGPNTRLTSRDNAVPELVCPRVSGDMAEDSVTSNFNPLFHCYLW